MLYCRQSVYSTDPGGVRPCSMCALARSPERTNRARGRVCEERRLAQASRHGFYNIMCVRVQAAHTHN